MTQFLTPMNCSELWQTYKILQACLNNIGRLLASELPIEKWKVCTQCHRLIRVICGKLLVCGKWVCQSMRHHCHFWTRADLPKCYITIWHRNSLQICSMKFCCRLAAYQLCLQGTVCTRYAAGWNFAPDLPHTSNATGTVCGRSATEKFEQIMTVWSKAIGGHYGGLLKLCHQVAGWAHDLANSCDLISTSSCLHLASVQIFQKSCFKFNWYHDDGIYLYIAEGV